MPEINLLPDELRGKEEKEQKKVLKKPNRVDIEMSSPDKEHIEQDLKVVKPSFFSRLFSKKSKSDRPIMRASEKDEKEKSEEKSKTRETEKILHIPGMSEESAKPDFEDAKPSVLSRLFAAPANPTKFLSKTDEEKEEREEEKEEREEEKEERRDEEEKDTEKVLHISKEKEEDDDDDEEKSKTVIKSKKKKFSFSDWLKNLTKKGKSFKKSDKKDSDKETEGKRESTLDVNLIPAELARHPELGLTKKLFTSGTIIFIFALIIGVAYLGIIWYQLGITRQADEVKMRIVNLDKEIARYEQGKAETLQFQKRLEVIRGLIDNHVYWTKFFALLEKHTIPDVYYTGFSMTGDESLSLAAVGKNYESVAKQLIAFEEATDFVKGVRIDAAAAEINRDKGIYLGVSFSINLEFQPDVFFKPIN